MTVRALVTGLLATAVLAAVAFFNDMVIRNTQLIGNYLPMSVFGLLILAVLPANVLWHRFRGRVLFTPRELAVVLGIVLFACCIPGRSLMHLFTNQLMMPHHHAQTEVAWGDVVDRVPERLLADGKGDPERAVKGFVLGLREGDAPFSPAEVPWSAWTRTLGFWMPLVATFLLAVTGLSLAVHRQWYRHEHLPYPVVQFSRALFPGADSGAAPILRNHLFLAGAGAVLAIHGINYLALWYPERMIGIRLSVDISPIAVLIRAYEPYTFLYYPRLYFTALGFAYFVAGDVSFSVGIAPYLFYFCAGVLGRYGLNIAARQAADGVGFFLYAGAFVGMFAVIAFTGRRYYLSSLRRAACIRGGDAVPAHAVWGWRLCFAAAGSFVVQLAFAGLDWRLGILFAALALIYYTVISRLNVESGLFFIQAYLMPGGVLWGFLGDAAGLSQLLIMGLVGMLLTFETRELLMPFAVNALALSDGEGVRPGGAAARGIAAIVLAFAIAVPVTLYWQYREGSVAASYGYSTIHRPKMIFNMDSILRRNAEARGIEYASDGVPGWGRFLSARPRRDAVAGFAVAFVLVIAFGLLRLRFRRWPLHPAFLLVLGSWPGISLGPSFLLGWAVKTGVTHYGGARLYRKLRPLMIGLITGEMCAGVLMMGHALLYYAVTGLHPKTMWLMPG